MTTKNTVEPSNERRSEPYVWVNPPATEIPLTGSQVRFAVGTPAGTSTSSWKVRVRGDDTYVACRDNFREIKVSLHASGIWRLGFTEQAVRARPELLPPKADRAWKKWRPPVDEKPAIIAFQLVVPRESLYLQPKQRNRWPNTILFVEPPAEATHLAVVSVVVVRSTTALPMGAQTRGAVIGVLPLGRARTVQLVATYQDKAPISRAFQKGVSAERQHLNELVPPNGVITLPYCKITVAKLGKSSMDRDSIAGLGERRDVSAADPLNHRSYSWWL